MSVYIIFHLQESVKTFKEELGLTISVSTLSRHKISLGFPMGPAQQCNTTRDKNLPLRAQFAQRLLAANHQMNHFIFVDESSFQTHSNRKMGTNIVNKDEHGKKIGKTDRYKVYKPKHPLKLHVWGGISRRGKTDIVIFKGIMDGPFYREHILPIYIRSAEKLYPHGDVEMWADNDPKDTCKVVTEFMEEKGIAAIKTPAESPDMNPIENVWAQMKADVRKESPKTQDALCTSIIKAWDRIDVAQCNTYIDHVKNTAIPEVVRVEGYATGM